MNISITVTPIHPSPCKDCTNRHHKCHCNCKQYNSYKIETEKARPDWKYNDVFWSLVESKMKQV